MGILYTRWGQHENAVPYYEKALTLDREKNDRRGEANALCNLGHVYWDWGRYATANSYYEKALAVSREIRCRHTEGLALNGLGNLNYYWGRYEKAANYYEQSLAIRRELKDRRGEGKTLNNLGLIFADWGQYDKALDFYNKCLVIHRELGNRLDEAGALNNLALVYLHRGDRGTAMAHIRQALTIWRQMKVSVKGPKNLVGHLHMDEGNLVNAAPLVRDVGYPATLGRFYLLQRKYDEAKSEYEALLAFSETARRADDLFTAYTGLGMAYEGIGDNRSAAEFFKKAVAFTEELRTSVTANQREKFFDVTINGFLRTVPYEGLARVLMRMKKRKEALKGSEYTKARVFAETISRQAEGQQFDVPPKILKQDQAITDQLAALKKQRQKAYEKKNKLTIEALEPQIKELEAKLQAHIKMLRSKYPLFAATKYPEPMDLSQTALNDNEWTLSYDVTDSGVLVYLTKGKELVKALFKPIPRKGLDKLVRKFREPLEVSERYFVKKLKSFDFACGKKLSDLLLSDMLSDLPEGIPVIVIPDDSLGVVPFEMLVLKDSGKVVRGGKYPSVQGAQFFGDRNPISYYQSITALTLVRTFGKATKAAPKRMVMADPVFDVKDSRLANANRQRRVALMKSMQDKLLSIKNEMGLTFLRLPLTGELAKTLKELDPKETDLYTGMKASKPVLFEKPLTKYGSIVFATHGYFGKDLPGIQEPVLVLTLLDQPKGQDGFLRMSEVMGLKLNSDVVALTACQTGLGPRISGEGTMGMGRAFQYAGAKAVLMTLWSVAEKSSVILTESFFRHLKEGKSKLESLRLARKEIREAGYDHPFFWAPFILV